MAIKLDPTDKAIISSGIIITAVLTGAVLLWTDEIQTFVAGEPQASTVAIQETHKIEVSSTTPETVPTQAVASISITDDQNGNADIYLNLSESVELAGAELYFGVQGDVLGTSVECSDTFNCVGSEITDELIAIYAFRPIDQARTELSGQVKVATLTYDPLKSITLTANDTSVDELLVVAVGSEVNLAESAVRSFSIGK